MRCAQVLGRLARQAAPSRGAAETLQHLGIQVDQDRLGGARCGLLRPLHVALVPVAHVLVAGGSRWWNTQSFCAYISHWRGLGSPTRNFSPPCRASRRGSRCRAGLGLPVDDEVRVVAVLCAAVLGDEGRQLQPRAEFDQHLLERLAVAGRRQHRDAHRVDRAVELADRPVEHRHHVVALEVGRVGQDRSANAVISEWKASRRPGTGSCIRRRSPLSLSIARTSDVFIVEFHAMLAMKISSVSIGTGRRARRW